MSLRRMLPFLFLNVLVSLAVILGVLYLWERRTPAAPEPTPLALLPAGDAVTAELPPAVPGAALPVVAGAEEEEPVAAEEPAEEGPTIHVVAAGDTLGGISAQYDVEMDDIVAANGIVNINALSIGQELIIPIGGLPTPTPASTSAPTEAPPPTPRPTEPLPSGTAIVEITEVIGVNNLASEAVRITNSGTRPITLRDWKLVDEHGNIYTFGDITLFGSSAAGSPSILVHTEAGRNGPSDLYWGKETAVWETGETATLFDAEDTVQATYRIP
jgi:hypothetical protein